jgi:uncharacterized protein (DUF983 family)
VATRPTPRTSQGVYVSLSTAGSEPAGTALVIGGDAPEIMAAMEPPVPSSVPGEESGRSWRQPSRVRLLLRGLSRRCPVCGEARIRQGYFRLKASCPRCGLRFTRLEGQWSGDIGINTIVTFTLLYVVLLGGTLLMWGDIKVGPLALAALLVVVVFPVLFVPFAKTLWLAIDLAMRPVQADEFLPPNAD